MSKSLKRVKQALADVGVQVEVLELGPDTRTAQQAADAANCDINQIAKSIIFQGVDTGTLFLFVTAGGNQVSTQAAEQLTGEPLTKADAAAVRTQTGFAIGGVSPVGHLTPTTGFFDPDLLDYPVVYAAAGTPKHIFAIEPAHLQKISDCQLSEFKS